MMQSSINRSYSYGKQLIEDDDIQAVVDVLKSDWLTQGPNVKNFEDALGKKLGSRYATVVCNGTAALHLAGLALGWKTGDIVLTSPLTFLASANCILYAGATPDFVDIDPASYTIDVNKLEDKIKFYANKSKKVKAVIAIDFAGHPCDWAPLRELANRYELQLIDDACHALGAAYQNDPIGSSKYADVTILSFHPVKHITTGEGGAILTNDKAIDEKVKVLRTHGITKDGKSLQKNDGPWYYEMHELGFNYRITDFQCALGVNQLNKLSRFILERQRIAKYYDSVFSNDDRFTTPKVSANVSHAYHLYPMQLNFDSVNKTKRELFEGLRKRNINCQVHYIPVHLQPYYGKNFGFEVGDFPIAEKFYKREVSLPMYPALDDNDLEYISTSVRDICVS